MVFVAIAVVVPVIVLGLFRAMSRKPANLGPVEGRLADCPDSANCVCTQATDDAHRLPPISFSGSPEEALAKLQRIIAAFPRTNIVTANPRYLHAEFTSGLFRFVDDVEFLIDEPARQIHFRSASRVGQSDFGVNRRRMEALRTAFEKP